MLPNLSRIPEGTYTHGTQPKIYEIGIVNQTVRLKSGALSQSSKKVSQRNTPIAPMGDIYRKNHSMDQNNKMETIKGPIYIHNNKNMPDLSNQIKLIQKKIRMCQKKIEDDKRKQQQLYASQQNQNQYDFDKVIKHEFDLQMGRQPTLPNQQNFDYLTNPGKNVEEQVVQPDQSPSIEPQLPKAYNIYEGLEKMEKHYENNLRRKFQRREIFPHQPCKRKTPKLYITQKNNALNKQGKPKNDEEHKFRILTKETTPQQIYPTIPNFPIVKDVLSKNIMAYLGQYKPFLEKTKDNAAKVQKQTNEQNQVINLHIDK